MALSREVSTAFGFAYAVVVTQHAYSARRRWQLVVPVLDVCDLLPEGAAPEQFAPEPWDVLPVPAPWWRVLPRDWAVPVFDTARLISFSEAWENGRDRGRWLKGQIERILPATIDHATLEWIEKAVVARFGCVA